jgi:hypothetical protein
MLAGWDGTLFCCREGDPKAWHQASQLGGVQSLWALALKHRDQLGRQMLLHVENFLGRIENHEPGVLLGFAGLFHDGEEIDGQDLAGLDRGGAAPTLPWPPKLYRARVTVPLAWQVPTRLRRLPDETMFGVADARNSVVAVISSAPSPSRAKLDRIVSQDRAWDRDGVRLEDATIMAHWR